jgi:CheY-like chemotaxis protein
MIIKLAGLILERLGYQAEFARHGREAVDKYRQAMNAGKPFDAVLLDLTVRGGQGGQDAIQELISLDPSVKGIVSSGYSDSPVLTDFRRYGFKGVVVKPYSLAELSQVLYHVLND